jgi:hypothetical protein
MEAVPTVEAVNWFMTIWNWFTTGDMGAWVSAITIIVTAANGITMLFPSTANNAFLGAILKILNFLAINVLKNKNADAA